MPVYAIGDMYHLLSFKNLKLLFNDQKEKYIIDGHEIISLKGYQNFAIKPDNTVTNYGPTREELYVHQVLYKTNENFNYDWIGIVPYELYLSEKKNPNIYTLDCNRINKYMFENLNYITSNTKTEIYDIKKLRLTCYKTNA
jgi:hypothetical protein